MSAVVHIDEETMRNLEALARSHGLTVEEQIKAMVGRDLSADRKALIQRAAELRQRSLGLRQTPAEVLVRESRDER